MCFTDVIGGLLVASIPGSLCGAFWYYEGWCSRREPSDQIQLLSAESCIKNAWCIWQQNHTFHFGRRPRSTVRVYNVLGVSRTTLTTTQNRARRVLLKEILCLAFSVTFFASWLQCPASFRGVCAFLKAVEPTPLETFKEEE